MEAILHNTITNLIYAAFDKLFSKEEKSGKFDHLLTTKDGSRIAIEVLSKSPSNEKITQLFELASKYSEEIDELYIVIPEAPDKKTLSTFQTTFKPLALNFKLIDINKFPEILGLKNLGNLSDPKVIDEIQTNTLISNIAKYTTAPIGLEYFERKKRVLESFDKDAKLPFEYKRLERQFPYSTLSRFYEDYKKLPEILRIGERCNNITVTLSDIKNFSSLVKVARPDDLNEIMGKYYSKARELVYDHKGMLDKFIGDAVLAIFGYPYQDDRSVINAIEFSKDLIILGKDILEQLLIQINELIETGTRIGCATGDVWPLDIGDGFLEMSLVGDTINLAARLEKKCSVNGILIDNRSRTAALVQDAISFKKENFLEKIIQPSDAKGQILPIKAWQSKIY